MKPDGIVLDLDDTLFETTRLLLPWADRRAVAAMREAGLAIDEETALARLVELRRSGVVRTFSELARSSGAPESCAETGAAVWLDYEPPPMDLEPRVAVALDELAGMAPLVLFTLGHPRTQRRKAERLGLAARFSELRFIDSRGAAGKTETLAEILADHGWAPDRVVVCGDRPDGDVRAANLNGCVSVLVRAEGTEFANVESSSPDDVPSRTISHVAELPALLRSL
jgi:putative hydrolase of the HAD superfamily